MGYRHPRTGAERVWVAQLGCLGFQCHHRHRQRIRFVWRPVVAELLSTGTGGDFGDE